MDHGWIRNRASHRRADPEKGGGSKRYRPHLESPPLLIRADATNPADQIAATTMEQHPAVKAASDKGEKSTADSTGSAGRSPSEPKTSSGTSRRIPRTQ